MPYQNYIPPQQQQFYQPILPPGKNDLEILENLKSIIKEGQHEFYRAVPQPTALASLYMGHIPQGQVHPDQFPQEYPTRFSHDTSVDNTNGLDSTSQSVNNVPFVFSHPSSHSPLSQIIESHSPLSGVDTSPVKLGADPLNVLDASVQPDLEDTSRIITQGPPVDTKSDPAGEYGARQPVDTALPNKATPFDPTKDDEPPQLTGENAWDRRTIDDRKARYEDRNANTYESRSVNGTTTTTTDARLPPAEDNRLYDRDRDRDRDRFIDRDRDRDWERDRDRHDSIRDTRDRGRDRDIRDRRSEFFGRSYGRSHAPRPPPELRHYEPSYGADFVPPSRRHEPDDKRGGLRSAPVPPLDDRSKPPPLDDRRPSFDDRRPPPPAAADDRRLTLDDRPIRPLPGSDTRSLPPSSEDRVRPAGEVVPSARATAEDDRGPRATSLAVDDRPRVTLPLEERLSQAAPAPSLQDRLSQPTPAVVPPRVDIPPSLEERLSLGPVSRTYVRAASVARDDLRAPLPKDDLRDHDRITDFRTNRDFSRERPGGPLTTASTYRPDLDRGFGDRDERDRRERDVANVDAPPARFGDSFSRVGPPPQRRYSPPPPMFDRDRERGRSYYPTRSPPPFRGESAYYPDGERRYGNDRERDAYEQRRREWYGPGDDDKRGPPVPPPPASWRPHERPPFMDRDRERFDRERERERDVRERDRERERDRDMGGLPPPPPPPPPTRGHWDDRDRRFPLSPPPSRMDTTGGIGPSRSLSARLTDPYPPPLSGGDERTYAPPPREFDRGRYGPPGLDDHPRAHALPFSRVRNRSPSPPRRGPGPAEDMRPPMKRVREDNGPGYAGVGGVGSAYSPPRRGEYVSGPPPSSTMTTTSVVTSVSGTVPPRSAGTGTPPVSAPPPTSGASSAFYERGGIGEREREREREQREREREREYVRGEYGMGYDRDGRGRRSPPLGSRMGSGGGYGRGAVGDRRDDRRYVPPPPPRTS